MNLTVNFKPLSVLGYVLAETPPDLYFNLHQQVKQLKDNNFLSGIKHNERLYGAIEHEYSLNDNDKNMLEKYLNLLILEYFKFTYQNTKKWKLNSFWVNFQKKFELNGLHVHDSDLSFVIWISIPYDLEKEKNIPNVKDSDFKNFTTSFSFIYPCFLNQNTFGINKETIMVDKSFEGKIILFDSRLLHMVYPFYTSDEYRISIAGNISFLE